MLTLNKNSPRTFTETISTGPRLGRYRFRVQQSHNGTGPDYYVSYKEGWFGFRFWVHRSPFSPETFCYIEDSYGAALPSYEEAMLALEWARADAEKALRCSYARRNRHHLKTIVEDR